MALDLTFPGSKHSQVVPQGLVLPDQEQAEQPETGQQPPSELAEGTFLEEA